MGKYFAWNFKATLWKFTPHILSIYWKMYTLFTWWRHRMETFSALLALCEGNPPVTGGFPSQRPVTRNFDVFVDLRLNKRLSKQSRRLWFEKPLHSLWRHCNADVKSKSSSILWAWKYGSVFNVLYARVCAPLHWQDCASVCVQLRGTARVHHISVLPY